VSAKPLSRRRALITGASAGIGEAFAREFASHGFDLVLVARRTEKLEAIARELAAVHDVDVVIRVCDLLDADAAQALFDDCGGLDVDVLVNNAGLMYHGSFCEQDLTGIDGIVQLNIASLTRLSRLFLQPMLEKKSGRILNVASTTGFKAGPTVAVYAASKAYIISFTEALAEELRGTGVYATAFCPGSTDTSMLVSSFGEDLRTDPVGSLLMMSTTDVARAGFKACMAGEVISIPGLANNIINSIGRLQPRWMSRRVQSYLYKKLLDEK
jgi:short-subunit dehydrogenase